MQLWIDGGRANCGLANVVKIRSATPKVELEFPYGATSNLHVRLEQNEIWDASQWGAGPRYTQSLNLPGPGRYRFEISMDAPAQGVLSTCQGILVYEPEVDRLLTEFIDHCNAEESGVNREVITQWSRTTGRLSALLLPTPLPLPGGSREEKSLAFVARWGALFGLASETTLIVSVGENENFGRNVLLRQRRAGEPALHLAGHDVRFFFNEKDELIEIYGSGFPDLPQVQPFSTETLANAKAALETLMRRAAKDQAPIPLFLYSVAELRVQQGWLFNEGRESYFVDLEGRSARKTKGPHLSGEMAKIIDRFMTSYNFDDGSWSSLDTEVAVASLEVDEPPGYLERYGSPSDPPYYSGSKAQARQSIALAAEDLNQRFARRSTCAAESTVIDFNGNLQSSIPQLTISVVDRTDVLDLPFAGMFDSSDWTITLNNVTEGYSWLVGPTPPHELTHLVQKCGKSMLQFSNYAATSAAFEGLAELGAVVFPLDARVSHERWSQYEFNTRTQSFEFMMNYLRPDEYIINGVLAAANMNQYYYQCPQDATSNCAHANGAIIVRAAGVASVSHGVENDKLARLSYGANVHIGSDDDIVSTLEYMKKLARYYRRSSQYGFEKKDVCGFAKGVREVGIMGTPDEPTYCGWDICRPCEDDDDPPGSDPAPPGEALLYRCYYLLKRHCLPPTGEPEDDCSSDPVPAPTITNCANLDDDPSDDSPDYRSGCRYDATYCGVSYIWGTETPVLGAHTSEICNDQEGVRSNAFAQHSTPICGISGPDQSFTDYLGGGCCEELLGWGCRRAATQPVPACQPN